jgi:hypothetical protein
LYLIISFKKKILNTIRKGLVFIFTALPLHLSAQFKSYNFNLYEGRDYYFTMSQSNDLVQNSQRLVGNYLVDEDSQWWKRTLFHVGQSYFTTFFGQAFTHGQGHRSVLSELGIHSVNKPTAYENDFFGKVIGVTNETLINLRETDLPNYIRMHDAGLESDYAYLKKLDAKFNFGEETYTVMYWDYFWRIFQSQMYFANLIKPLSSVEDIEKSIPEKELDIVGHDLYGRIRHIHRPTMEFYRYTDWEDLTKEEQSYGKRMGKMALLNLLNPNIFRLGIFRFSKFNAQTEIKGSLSINYSLAPFGDFIEQNAYLNVGDKYKLNPYIREYFNKSDTFLAAGIKLNNYVFDGGKYLLNSSVDIWNQPENFDFNSKLSDFGFGVKTELAVRLLDLNSYQNSAYANLGMSYKTNGFIPEISSLYEDFNVYLGFVYSVNY